MEKLFQENKTLNDLEQKLFSYQKSQISETSEISELPNSRSVPDLTAENFTFCCEYEQSHESNEMTRSSDINSALVKELQRIESSLDQIRFANHKPPKNLTLAKPDSTNSTAHKQSQASRIDNQFRIFSQNNQTDYEKISEAANSALARELSILAIRLESVLFEQRKLRENCYNILDRKIESSKLAQIGKKTQIQGGQTAFLEPVESTEANDDSSFEWIQPPESHNQPREELIGLAKMTQQSLNRTLGVMDKVLNFLSSNAK